MLVCRCRFRVPTRWQSRISEVRLGRPPNDVRRLAAMARQPSICWKPLPPVLPVCQGLLACLAALLVPIPKQERCLCHSGVGGQTGHTMLTAQCPVACTVRPACGGMTVVRGDAWVGVRIAAEGTSQTAHGP